MRNNNQKWNVKIITKGCIILNNIKLLLGRTYKYWISFIIIFIPNLLAWLVFYPGYFQADHQNTIANIAIGTPDEWHSLFWGYLSYPFFVFFKSYSIYGILQILVFSFFIIFGLNRLLIVNFINKKTFYSLVVFMALFPTFILYNLLYSSDIIFAYVLFVLTCLFINLWISLDKIKNVKIDNIRDAFKWENKLIVWIFIFLLLACLLRKNGLIVACVFSLVFIIKGVKKYFILYSISLSTIVLSLLVSFSFQFILHADKSPNQEMMSVPATQISYVYHLGRDIPEDINSSFQRFKSPNDWANTYCPFSADNAKLGVNGDLDFLINWIKLGLIYPLDYLKAYYALECGFWELGMNHFYSDPYFNVGTSIDFSQHDEFTLVTFNKCNNDIEDDAILNNYIKQFGVTCSNIWHLPSKVYNFINNYGNVSLVIICNFVLFNRALPFWTLLILLIISLFCKKGWTFIFVSLPVWSVLISLLLFSPVALIRYSMELYYSLPLLFIYSFYSVKYKKMALR